MTGKKKLKWAIQPKLACLRGNSALTRPKQCLTFSLWLQIQTYFSSSSSQKQLLEDTPKMMLCLKFFSQVSKTLIKLAFNAQTNSKIGMGCLINSCLMLLWFPTTWISSSWSLQIATWWVLWITHLTQGPRNHLFSVVLSVKTRHLPRNQQIKMNTTKTFINSSSKISS